MDNPPLAITSTTIYQVFCVPPARFERATHGLGNAYETFVVVRRCSRKYG